MVLGRLEGELELSESKTVISHITEGFDFLGCNVNWYKNKLLIKPSDENYKAVINKVRGIIKANLTLKQSLSGWITAYGKVYGADIRKSLTSVLHKNIFTGKVRASGLYKNCSLKP